MNRALYKCIPVCQGFFYLNFFLSIRIFPSMQLQLKAMFTCIRFTIDQFHLNFSKNLQQKSGTDL